MHSHSIRKVSSKTYICTDKTQSLHSYREDDVLCLSPWTMMCNCADIFEDIEHHNASHTEAKPHLSNGAVLLLRKKHQV